MLHAAPAIGTIGGVRHDRRIRLTDGDLDLIVSALRARRAMARGDRLHELDRLIERLAEPARGNPQLRFSPTTQSHRELAP